MIDSGLNSVLRAWASTSVQSNFLHLANEETVQLHQIWTKVRLWQFKKEKRT